MTWFLKNLDVVGLYTANHLAQALPAIVLSFILSIPLGYLGANKKWFRAPVATGSAVLYAIPSLPLFIVLPLITGAGLRNPLNVVVALTLYGLALMVPTTIDGLSSVPQPTIQAATALGYGRWRRFFAVELPLAGPALLAGLRVVAVSTVSLVTVGAVLGVPSLGILFTDGFQRGINAAIITGVVLTALLALACDALLVLLGKLLLPWARSRL